jgi:hypothetical protein
VLMRANAPPPMRKFPCPMRKLPRAAPLKRRLAISRNARAQRLPAQFLQTPSFTTFALTNH